MARQSLSDAASSNSQQQPLPRRKPKIGGMGKQKNLPNAFSKQQALPKMQGSGQKMSSLGEIISAGGRSKYSAATGSKL